MTMKNERTYAVQKTRAFLFALMRFDLIKRVPIAVREMAYECLKHYPWDRHLENAARGVGSSDWGEPEEEDYDLWACALAKIIAPGPRRFKARQKKRKRA